MSVFRAMKMSFPVGVYMSVSCPDKSLLMIYGFGPVVILKQLIMLLVMLLASKTVCGFFFLKESMI